MHACVPCVSAVTHRCARTVDHAVHLRAVAASCTRRCRVRCGLPERDGADAYGVLRVTAPRGARTWDATARCAQPVRAVPVGVCTVPQIYNVGVASRQPAARRLGRAGYPTVRPHRHETKPAQGSAWTRSRRHGEGYQIYTASPQVRMHALESRVGATIEYTSRCRYTRSEPVDAVAERQTAHHDCARRREHR